MKMEAADPFNVPVDPEALGIPVSLIISFFFVLYIHHFWELLLHFNFGF